MSRRRRAAKRGAGRPRPPTAAPVAAADPGSTPSRARVWLVGLGIALTAVFAYWPITGHDFVNYDDHAYVVDNPRVATGLTAANARWALTAFEAGNWHPLTMLSHMLDVQLWGLRPGTHHATSLALHALNSALLVWGLARLTGALWPAALVAALFAVHPLNVESVAWVAERKNVLSTTFWLLTTAAYAAWARRPTWWRYGLMLVAFALGLAAKPMLVTLPCTLLLLDWWPLGRFDPRAPDRGRRAARLVAEKLPLFALVAAASLLALAAQSAGGAVASLAQVPLGPRLANAVVAYVAYLGQTLWPVGLAVFYPHPGYAVPTWKIAGASLLLLALSALALWQARRQPWLLVGWLWYLGTLVPVIGIVQVGQQAMADRYAYVPLLGLFVAVAWSVAARVPAAWRAAGWRGPGPWAALTAVGVLVALGAATRAQAGHWRDSLTLFEHARAVTERNYVALTNIGLVYAQQKSWERAIALFREAIQANRHHGAAYMHLGVALAKTGRMPEAIRELSTAVRMAPGDADAHNNLGIAYLRAREPDRAAAHFRRALAARPDLVDARINLGAALIEQGRDEEARHVLGAALAAHPNFAGPHFRLGSVLLDKGDLAGAERHLRRALELRPGHADAHNNLSVVLLRRGRVDEALGHARATVRLEPRHADGHSNLGTALVRKGELAGAVSALEQALVLNPSHADAHATLGAVRARGGHLAAATEHFTRAVAADPTNVTALNNLGAALLQQGRVAEAVEQLTRALDRSPDHADAHANLGAALLQQGKAVEAAAHFRAALRRDPRHPVATAYLGAAGGPSTGPR